MSVEVGQPAPLPSLWLIATGEPLPLDGAGTRLLRTGLFFHELVARGHSVHWWTAGFDHAHRAHRTRQFSSVPVGETGRISLIPSPGYGSSVSPRRIVDHAVTARRFLRHARHAARPGVVYCSYPTIALSRAAVRFGLEQDVPVILDIRDLWPDAIWDTVVGPRGGRLRQAVVASLRRLAIYAIGNATAVIGLTDEYVDWALNLAGRTRGPLDEAIPISYPEDAPLTREDREDAERFWRGKGVDFERHWVVCFLGTVGRQFDLSSVIDAAARVHASHQDVRFVLCGTGDGLDAARAQASRLDNVILPGWVDGSVRQLLLEEARVGLAPYRPTENFRLNLPNKPVEYFANGLPVLYPIDGVLDRVCTENGCGMRYHGISGRVQEGLDALIDRLYADVELHHDMAKRALELFRRDFVSPSVTDRLLEHSLRVTGTA